MGKTDRRTDELAVTISRIACLRAIKMKLFWDTELFSVIVVGYRTWSQYGRYQQGNSAFAGAALSAVWRIKMTKIVNDNHNNKGIHISVYKAISIQIYDVSNWKCAFCNNAFDVVNVKCYLITWHKKLPNNGTIFCWTTSNPFVFQSTH